MISDAQLYRWFELSKTDERLTFLVGSEVRQLIGEIQKSRKVTAAISETFKPVHWHGTTLQIPDDRGDCCLTLRFKTEADVMAMLAALHITGRETAGELPRARDVFDGIFPAHAPSPDESSIVYGEHAGGKDVRFTNPAHRYSAANLRNMADGMSLEDDRPDPSARAEANRYGARVKVLEARIADATAALSGSNQIGERIAALEKDSHSPVDIRPMVREIARQEVNNGPTRFK